MISYDNYKNRILKLAKAKRILHKFRFLIGGALAVIIAGSVGLMVAKGAYTSDMSLPAQIAFGEDYEPTMANAFLDSKSSQKVEYSPADGGDWTTAKPVKAGKYRARTVSPKLVGYSYSNVVEFEITKRDMQFAITGDRVVYGNTPECNVAGLISGHSVVYSELVFNYSPYASVSTVEVDPASFRITDASGEDFTDCYNVELIGKEGMRVSKKKISVKPQSASFTYNGAAQSYESAADEPTRRNLANGDEIIIETNVSDVKDAGVYTARVTGYKIMHGETDVTHMYEVSELTAAITVLQRQASFTFEGGSKIYDGTPLLSNGINFENLVEGHSPEIVGGWPSITDVGTLTVGKNDVILRITDDNGSDVTHNYEYTLEAESLQILPCEIKFTTKDMEWTYDGDAHDYLYYDLGTQISGFTFSAASLGAQSEITDFGTKPNRMGLTATNAYGEDVTKNFKFIPTYGTLKINKRKITVTTGDLIEVFNGEEQWTDSGEVTSGTLVYGQEIEADFARICTVKNVGNTPNTTQFNVYDYYGTPVTQNYEISYVNGTLTITPKHIIITTDDGVKEYDGTPLYNDGYTTDLNPWSDELYNGDKLVLVGEPAKITDAGDAPNANLYRVPNGNYVIDETVSGKLTVLPKAVEIHIENQSLVYGENIPDGVYNKSVELVNGETLTFTTHIENAFGSAVTPEKWEEYTLLNVGYYLISENSDRKITGGNARLDNYSFSIYDGTLTVTQREIVVITQSATKEYDGSPLQNTAYETEWAGDRTKAGLLGGDIDTLIPAKETTTLLEVYSCANSNEYIAPNGNYKVVEHEFGTLTITHRPILIITASASKTYDGTPLSKTDDYTVKYLVIDEVTGEWKTDESKPGLIGDDQLTLVETAEITDAGSELNLCYYEHVNSYGSSNYAIHYDLEKLGTLTVEKVKLDIRYKNESLNYTYGYIESGDAVVVGQLQYVEELENADGSKLEMPDGQRITVFYKVVGVNGVPDVGEYTIRAYRYEVWKNTPDEVLDEGAVLNNYEVNCGDSTLKVTPYELYGKVANANMTYGNALPEFSVVIQSALFSFETISFEYGLDREVNGVGEYVISVTGLKVYDNNYNLKPDGYKNYSISSIESGILTVDKRGLTVRLNYFLYSQKIEYGTPWSYATGIGNYESVSGLADGEQLEVAVTVYSVELAQTVAKPVNAGAYIILLDYENCKVYAADGKEIIGGINNYDVTYMQGKLMINQAPLTVTLPEVADIVYGNQPKFDPKDIKVEGLKYEETVNIAVNIIDAYNNVVETIKKTGVYRYVLDEENTEVINKDLTVGLLSNYRVECESRLFNVTVKPITVTFEDSTLTYGDFSSDKTYSYNFTLSEPLANGESIEFTSYSYLLNGKIVSPRDVGAYVIYGRSFTIYYADGTPDRANQNYRFDYKGSLIIEKKVLDIYKIYGYASFYGTYTDGYADTVGKQNFRTVGDGKELSLPYEEDLFVDWRIMGVGEDEIPPASKDGYVLHAVNYKIFTGNYYNGGNVLDEGDGEHLKNYIINCEDSHLSVYAREITLNVNNVTIYYGDDLPKEFKYYYAASNMQSFLEMLGESLEFEFGFEAEEVKNAGTYPFVVKSVKVYDEDGNLKIGGENNYEVSCNGALKIAPKAINISIEPKSLTYGDPVPETGNDYNILENGVPVLNGVLSNGETLKISVIYYMSGGNKVTPKNVGKYAVVADGYEVYKDGVLIQNGINNYDIHCAPGMLEITKKPVTVVLNEIAPVTYGETFSYPTGKNNYANVSEAKLANGEILEIAVDFLINGEVGIPKNATSRNNPDVYSARINLKESKIYESEDSDTLIDGGLNNYEITCEDLENLVINIRTIYLYVNDMFNVPYGDLGNTVNYPDEIGNYRRVEYQDGNNRTEGVPYNEKFKIGVKYYENSDQIPDADSVLSDFMPTRVGRYYIALNVSETTVYNEDGSEGNMHNYKFAISLPYCGTLKIVSREITVKLSDYEIEYGDFYIDGKGGTFQYPDKIYNYDLENSDPLVYNQPLWVGFMHGMKYLRKVDGVAVGGFVTPKDVGTYEITFEEDDYAIFDADETYYDGCYDITFVAGTLKIVEKALYPKILEKEVTYGDDLPEIEWWLEDKDGLRVENLPYGDTVELVNFHYYLLNTDEFCGWHKDNPRLNAGVYQIERNAVLVNGSAGGEDRANYRIIGGTGILTVKRATLNLQLNKIDDAVYGDKRGYPAGFGNFDAANTVGIKNGDQFELAVKYEVYADTRNTGLVTVGDISSEIPTHVAHYLIHLDAENSLIRTASGKECALSLNYDVECASISFRIVYRFVIINFNVPEYTYGETVAKPDFSITVRTNALDQSEISTTELPYGEICDFDFEFFDEKSQKVYETPINAGTYNIRLKKQYVNGSEALAGNYVFGWLVDSNTLTVNKKSVDIKLSDWQKAFGYIPENSYVQKAEGFDGVNVYERVDGLTESVAAYGEALSVKVAYKPFGDVTGSPVTPKAVGKYTVVPVEYVISGYEGDLPESEWVNNYEINCADGTAEIIKATVTITVNANTANYGDDIGKLENGFTVAPEMPFGEEFVLSYSCNLDKPNAGEHIGAIGATVVGIKGEGASLDNYDVTEIIDGTLTVLPRKITVTTDNYSVVYGDALPEIICAVSEELPYGETLGLTLAYQYGNQTFTAPQNGCLNAYIYNIVIYTAAISGGNQSLDNYEIEEALGTLNITAKPVAVTIESNSCVYGEELPEIKYSVSEELPNGETLELTFRFGGYTTVKNAGVYAITPNVETINGGNERAENYDISYVENSPTLTIKQKTVTLALNGGIQNPKFEYGDDYDGSIRSVTVDGMVDGERLVVAVNYSAKSRAAAVAQRLGVGDYVAVLDWDNCSVFSGAGEVLGGLANYALDNTADLPSLDFSIVKKVLHVTVEGNSCNYGDELPEISYGTAETMPSGESLLLTFEFENENQTEVKNVDKYDILVATEDIVNGDYGNYDIQYVQNSPILEITARTISFELSKVTEIFGETVSYPAGIGNYESVTNAAYDELFEVTVKFFKNGFEVVNPTDAGFYDIMLDGITVYNSDRTKIENGENNYVFEKQIFAGLLEISSSKIRIETGSDKKVYDGDELVYDDYNFETLDFIVAGKLADGYTVKIEKLFGQTEVTDGDGVENKTDFAVYYNGAPSGNYEIEYDYGRLTVTPRPVNVYTESATEEYSGDPLTAGYTLKFDGDETKPAIIDGHTLTPAYAEQINVGSRPNEITFTVTDADGKDVTANYAFTPVETGTLTVTAKKVTVTISPAEAIYGEEIASAGFELDCGERLPDGKELSFEVIYMLGDSPVNIFVTADGYTLLDCGKYTIVADKDSVRVDGEETENYEFEFVDGKLTVNKRGIIVSTDDKSKLYDGTPLYLGGYSTVFADDESRAGLLNGDTLETVASELNDASLGITDHGTTDNRFTFSVSQDGNYYIVESVYGTLEILKRKVVIVTASDEKEYDGKPLEAENAEDFYALDGDGNADYALMTGLGHTISLTKRCSVINVTPADGVPNEAEYTIVDASGSVGVASNYEISYEYGNLIISKRALTIKLNLDGNTVFEYGDSTVAAQIENYSAEGLVVGETLEITVEYLRGGVAVTTPKNAGNYIAKLGSGSKVSNGTELENSIGNYEITCDEVSFTINRKAVTLNMGDPVSEEYNGLVHEFKNHTLADGNWAEYGDKLITVEFDYYTDENKQNPTTRPVNAGTYYVFLNADDTVISGGVALSDNYDVTCDPLEFTVTPKEITIKLSDVSSVYDGKAYDFAKSETGFTVDGLCGNDSVERTVIYADNGTGYETESPVNAGEYTITFDTSKFDMSNYVIAEDGNEFACTLKIETRDLNVEVADRIIELGEDETYTLGHLTTDFVEDDLENAGAQFTFTKDDGELPEGVAEQYFVSVAFVNASVMDNYNIVTNKSGTLTITRRQVAVTPVYIGEKDFVYNGQAVGEEYFGFSHVHESDGENGFAADDLNKISAVYTFVNILDSKDVYTDGAFPVNAGTYFVSVALSGVDGYVIGDDYFVEYRKATFTIQRRKVTLATENDGESGGLTEFVYSNAKPDFKAVISEDKSGYGEDSGIIGELPEVVFKLYIDGAEAKTFNVGTYEVRASFDGEANYEINWQSYKVEIIKRNLIVAPVNPYSEAQVYVGTDLTIGSEDYQLYQGTTLADGDKLYITASSLEPTKIKGTVSITSAKVVNELDENEDKSKNYNLYTEYVSGNPLFAGLRRTNFMVTLEYKQFTVLYKQIADGAEYPFTGSSITHKFDKNNAVEILTQEGYDGIYSDGNVTHSFSITAGEVTVSADAGIYTDWLNNGRIFKVTDNSGRNVTALYEFICNNAEAENKPVVVTRYVVEVALNGVSKDTLHTGTGGVLTAVDGVNTLNAANYAVSGLIDGHSAEIYAFETEEGTLLAISLYGTYKSGVKYDVAVNYECKAVDPIAGVRIEYMTLDEIAELSKPVLNIALDESIIKAENLANGLGTLYVPSEIDGSWVLTGGVTVSGINDKHFVDVIVYRQNGGYALAVTVYSKNTLGRRIDVSESYKIKGLPERIDGMSVSTVKVEEIGDLKRDAVIDFSGFVYGGDGKLAEESYTVSGLNTADGHVAEVYVTANGDGYELTVLIFKYRKIGSKEQRTDKRDCYEPQFILPEGVTVTVKTADVSTIYS